MDRWHNHPDSVLFTKSGKSIDFPVNAHAGFVCHLLGETPGYYKDCRDFWRNSSVHSVQYMCSIVPMNVTVLYCHFKQVVCGCCLLYIDVKDGTTECDVRTCNAWHRYFGSVLWTAHRFCALVMNCICFFYNLISPSHQTC